MNLKTKLNLGLGLLFLLIFLLGAVGVFYINLLKSDTANILTANYKSLQYVRQMQASLEEGGRSGTQDFEKYLRKQESNITELGEREATEHLRSGFEQWKKSNFSPEMERKIWQDMFQIIDVNMQALERKSRIAEKTAENATVWIAVSATLCFIIALGMLMNLPSAIADPIKMLTNSIKQIASQNYSQRVHLDNRDEFGELAHSFNAMAEKLEEFNKSNLAKLMMEKHRIETLINNMHGPVLGLDEGQRILFMNDRALRITGLKIEDVLGKEAQQVALRNDLIRNLIIDLSPTEENPAIENKPIKIYADGKESYFVKEVIPIDITPTAETQSHHIGDVILLQNVTSFKELDVAKTNFIATVSHELKTPIASMKLTLQLLENEKIGSINPEQKDLLHSLSDDANRLLKITSELLNLTQVETGNIQLSILPADPKEILNYALKTNKAQAEQKRIQFEIDCPKNIHPVLADSEKTAWVITNLISNAIRYSPEEGTVEIKISEDKGTNVFTVKDNGPGIPEVYREKIFERYFRIPGSKNDGTGLGLSISREFIEAQGGKIWVETEPGKGTSFKVLLKSQ